MSYLIKKAKAVGIVFAIGALTSQLALAAASVPLRFRGDWQGTLVNAILPLEQGKLHWLDPMHVRIVIKAGGVKLFRREDGRWEQLDDTLFQITARESNAIINAIWHTNNRTVTWSIAMSLIDTKHLHVAFMRQHKDKRVHLPNPEVVTVSVAHGTLELAPEATSP